MASNNPLNYSDASLQMIRQMPMGSHATAGGPHISTYPTNSMLMSEEPNMGIPQGPHQGPTPAAHQGMPVNLPPVTPNIPIQGMPGIYNPGMQVPMHGMPGMMQQIPMPQYPTGQPQTPTVPMMETFQQIPYQQAVPGVPTAITIPMPGLQQMTGAGPVDFDVLGSMPVMDVEYTQGYLRTQIGRKVKVEFLIGSDNYTDRQGTLVDVGISYIILNETDTDDLVLCDIYSIKFVRFYY